MLSGKLGPAAIVGRFAALNDGQRDSQPIFGSSDGFSQCLRLIPSAEKRARSTIHMDVITYNRSTDL